MEIKRLIVHGGVFHADDVMCACLAKELNPDVIIERRNQITDEMINDSGTIIADVGGGKYDHHQVDCERHLDGSKYCASTLLFRDIESDLFPNGTPDEFLKNLRAIELHDNGVFVPDDEKSMVTRICFVAGPTWDSRRTFDECFGRTVDVVQQNFVHPMVSKGHLSRMEKHRLMDYYATMGQIYSLAEESAKTMVTRCWKESDGKVVPLDSSAPWQKVLVPTDAEFVVYPSPRGGYNLQAIPPVVYSMERKVSLPRAWLDEKPEGCTFVHTERFLACFETKEQAIQAGREVVAQNMRSKRALPYISEDVEKQDELSVNNG